MTKKWKIKIAPNAFDKSISKENWRNIMKSFIQSVQDGSLAKRSKKIRMSRLQKEEPELYKRIQDLMRYS